MVITRAGIKLNSIEKCFKAVRQVLANLPTGWVELTTHRLDIYNEEQAKFEFLASLKALQESGDYSKDTLEQLPTAYDYIRLGHQLSCILEWLIAEINRVPTEQVVSFTSNTMPVLAIVRKNSVDNVPTYIYYDGDQSPLIDEARLAQVYRYKFMVHKVSNISEVPQHHDGTVVFVTQADYKAPLETAEAVDITVNQYPACGSTLVIHDSENADFAAEVQHVRRRETIAMSPLNCLHVLQNIVNGEHVSDEAVSDENIQIVHQCIKDNTGSSVEPLVASSGLSIQYAMLMGLVEDALNAHPGNAIQVILPPNCYGGTNDQARRIAEIIKEVSIVDLPVDGDNDMVSSLEVLLAKAADVNAVPLVLAEIPTNPRVEVPDMQALGKVLSAQRLTAEGEVAIAPAFMADQTFCPNVKLLGNNSPLAGVKVISYSSGSKFPSGGRCVAGYCAANDKAAELQGYIGKHLRLSDNGATANQYNTLAEQMPSMPERIAKAYENTRTLVNHIQSLLPDMKMNFVCDELAAQDFTPSVFSMDLPSTGETPQEREQNKRILNQKLIDHVLGKHPKDNKYCVSYGQLKGTYWTIPATSTQGTTKESDKDYIIRVALSPQTDVEALANDFTEFCKAEGWV